MNLETVLNEVVELAAQGRHMRAGIVLSQRIDDAIHSDDPTLATLILDRIDTAVLDGVILVGVLAATKAACYLPLEDARMRLGHRTIDALETHWGWDVSDISDVRKLL